MVNRALVFAFILGASSLPMEGNAFSLEGTMWERASSKSKCNAPALLLYSIALQESRTSAGKGLIKPHPFAMRNEPSGSLYPNTKQEAEQLLPGLIAEDRLTDIGMMQINYRWNGSRVARPEMLLNPETNIKVAADILCEAIAAQGGDIVLGIGGYHTLNPKREVDAKQYGLEVLSTWKALQRLGVTGDRN